jgi:phosphoglycerate dehydrogenase-like enzyme
MSGFKMTTLVFDPYVNQETFAAHGVIAVGLDELLTRADFVSLHCPLTLETHNLIGDRELKRMKPTAILINTSRGQVVDETALLRALSEGWIAGAGLDVFYIEETAVGNPFLNLDNVVATPHIGGFSDEDLETFWRESMHVVLDLANGRWPRSHVNPGLQPKFDHMKAAN